MDGEQPLDPWTLALANASPELRTWLSDQSDKAESLSRCPRPDWLLWALGRAGAPDRALAPLRLELARLYGSQRRPEPREAELLARLRASLWPLPEPPDLARCRPAIAVGWDRASEAAASTPLSTTDALRAWPLGVVMLQRVPQPSEVEARAVVALAWRLVGAPRALTGEILALLAAAGQ